MAKEIERKLLVDLAHWPNETKGAHFEQGYIAITDSGIVRVRIIRDEVSTLTVKSSGTGLSRDEFQYEIPMGEAKALLKLCQNDIIEKTRYHVIVEGKQWDVDQFHGNNDGLWIAEVELKSEDEQVTLPKWVTNEVTGDKHYYNAFISKHPYNTWKK